ncbi:MAG: SAM-dependent methyltransferase [Acidobacteria bacterium]|nr:SAM-dependent methyltransferase [Acidobacteriota bacterium]
MIEGESSRTAERMALERAAHQVADSPVVFADPLAIGMLRPEQAALLREHPERFHGSPIAKRRRAIVVVRSRIAEDEIARAADCGVTQYVVLGAGLDTFAYRNPHASVRVFEVDQPSTQRLKHERLATAGIAVPDNLTWVPFDFTRQTLPDALAAAGFDRTKPAVFAWLGVVMYLERLDAIETLRYISTLPTGTAVVFDYALPPEVTPWLVRCFYRRTLKGFARQGEPWISFFTPTPLRAELSQLGFTDIEDLAGDDVNRRYLGSRWNGLTASGFGRIVIARRM